MLCGQRRSALVSVGAEMTAPDTAAGRKEHLLREGRYCGFMLAAGSRHTAQPCAEQMEDGAAVAFLASGKGLWGRTLWKRTG